MTLCVKAAGCDQEQVICDSAVARLVTNDAHTSDPAILALLPKTRARGSQTLPSECSAHQISSAYPPWWPLALVGALAFARAVALNNGDLAASETDGARHDR
jgi:hypothetical protein